MAQERPLTPEKQLLNLIENPRPKDTAALQAQTARHKGLSLLSARAWSGRLSFSKDWLKKFLSASGKRQLDVKAINNLLGLGAAILSVCAAGNFTASIFRLRKMPYEKSEFKGIGAADTFLEGSLLKNSVSYYLEQIRQRDIFRMGPKKAEGETPEPSEPEGPSGEIIEATAHLKLVGISWSNDPDAMIEDTKALKTFFVKRGQMIGDVRVQAIFKDKVVLHYRGQEVELR